MANKLTVPDGIRQFEERFAGEKEKLPEEKKRAQLLFESGASLQEIAREFADSSHARINRASRAFGCEPEVLLHGDSVKIPKRAKGVNVKRGKRQAWMNHRHPGWSRVQWRDHTGIAFETLKKYWQGVTARQTPSVRARLREKEDVEFSTVPE